MHILFKDSFSFKNEFIVLKNRTYKYIILCTLYNYRYRYIEWYRFITNCVFFFLYNNKTAFCFSNVDNQPSFYLSIYVFSSYLDIQTCLRVVYMLANVNVGLNYELSYAQQWIYRERGPWGLDPLDAYIMLYNLNILK